MRTRSTDASFRLPLARAAEAAGYDSVTVAAMGAVTNTLRFTPFVLKLPVRRAVLRGEGWMQGGGPAEERLEDRGVTDVIVGFRVPYVVGPDTEPLARKIEHLERYAEHVIAKVR